MPMPDDRWWGWVGPLLVTALAGFLRFDRLSVPRKFVFDEVYYAKDSLDLLHHGVELNSQGTGPGFIAHPPLGKWLIAVGQAIFGHNSFGWRFSAAVVGTLSVLLLARIARRLFRSTLLGCFAGLLLTLDGLAFVQSRAAMLDIFLMFWVLAAFGCLVVDRDAARRRLAAAEPVAGAPAARLGFRPWLLAAGVCLGAACSTKWSGVYYVVAFVVLALAWEVGARRAAGSRRPLLAGLRRASLPITGALVGVAGLVYVASWSGWFLGSARTAYDHDWAVDGAHRLPHPVEVLQGWLHYHAEILNFHTTLISGHPYRSHPIGWLLLARPVSYFYSSPKNGELGCTAASGCAKEVLAIGTPVIWWASIAALVAMLWLWAARRDWRAGTILVGVAAGIVPWMYSDLHRRTEFFFYALPALPFLVLALTMCAGVALGRRKANDVRRIIGATAVGGYLLLVVLNFFYLYPVLAAKVIPYPEWSARMWFGSWI